MYESMIGPAAPPSAPATPRRSRLSSGSGSEPLSPRLSPVNPARGTGGASPTKPPMAVQPWGRALKPRSSEGSRGSPSQPQPLRPALRRVSADATAAAAVAAAPYSLPDGDAWRMPQRPRSHAGSVAGVLCSPRRPSPPSARRHLRSSSVCSEAGAISRGHSRRSSISRCLLLPQVLEISRVHCWKAICPRRFCTNPLLGLLKPLTHFSSPWLLALDAFASHLQVLRR